MKRLSTFAVVGLLPLIAACTLGPDLETTRNLAPTGTPFQQALYQEYLALAQTEDDEGDIEDAAYFNAKAVAAAAGATVLPQPVAERTLPSGIRGLDFEAQNLRDMLLIAIDDGAAEVAPNHAARAQAMFDCWLQELEENTQPDHIKRCRTGFETAMTAVDEALLAKTMARPEPAPAAAAPKELVFFFAFDSAELTAEGVAKAREIADLAPQAVQVIGHADTAGASAYNDRLSRLRADAVAKALVAAGVAAERIRVEAHGESTPARATGDGKKEPLNRRVTVIVD